VEKTGGFPDLCLGSAVVSHLEIFHIVLFSTHVIVVRFPCLFGLVIVHLFGLICLCSLSFWGASNLFFLFCSFLFRGVIIGDPPLVGWVFLVVCTITWGNVLLLLYHFVFYEERVGGTWCFYFGGAPCFLVWIGGDIT